MRYQIRVAIVWSPSACPFVSRGGESCVFLTSFGRLQLRLRFLAVSRFFGNRPPVPTTLIWIIYRFTSNDERWRKCKYSQQPRFCEYLLQATYSRDDHWIAVDLWGRRKKQKQENVMVDTCPIEFANFRCFYQKSKYLTIRSFYTSMMNDKESTSPDFSETRWPRISTATKKKAVSAGKCQYQRVFKYMKVDPWGKMKNMLWSAHVPLGLQSWNCFCPISK